MTDERDKQALPQDDEDNNEDVEAHKNALQKSALQKTSLQAEDDDNDVEAHKSALQKTSIQATGEDEKTSIQ